MTSSITAPRSLLLGGEWVDRPDKFEVIDPATSDLVAKVADASPADGRQAVEFAESVRETWESTAPSERSALLMEVRSRLLRSRDEFAFLISLESGKLIGEAQAEVDYSASFLEWFAGEAIRLRGEVLLAPNGGSEFIVSKVPVGTSLLITPWNFPLAMVARKMAPAIAAGCCVIVKPPPETPLTSAAFCSLFEEVGLPAGVIANLPTTRAEELVAPLLDGSRVRKLSFTGSSEVGSILLSQAAKGVLRTSMELGGNAPLLVFEDCDLDLAVEGTLIAKMRNNGQSCVAANRIYVQRPVYEEFLERFTEGMRSHQLAPVISERALDRIEGLVNEAVTDGAEIITGGERMAQKGFYFAPTVLANPKAGSRVLQEEIFGPVAPVVPFDDLEDAVEISNSTRFGLVAYAFTRDIGIVQKLRRQLDVGMVGFNTGIISNAAAPFGGVKASGIGREGGGDGIEEYVETRYANLPVS